MVIYQILEEANNGLFFPIPMQVNVLKNCPQTIPTLAQWMYEEWHSYDVSLTKEKLIHAFNHRLNDDRIPLTFVVLKKTLPIGMISLKGRDHEFSDFPENSLWMGSLQVIPEERNKGIGQALLKFAATVAKRLGYEDIYFYCSNPAHVKWYGKRGAGVIEERSFRNHMITIMHMPLTNI